MTTPAIPVPADVLRLLINITDTPEWCLACKGYRPYSHGHEDTCPIPALRKAVEEATKA